jgi:hypothetical protein
VQPKTLPKALGFLEQGQQEVVPERDKVPMGIGLFKRRRTVAWRIARGVMEFVLLSHFSVTADVVIGRTLACCAHPAAAWRRLSASGKALIVTAYFIVGYLGGLVLLGIK